MTAIITKQNARDRAFIGGNGGGSIIIDDVTAKEGEFENLHVKKTATIDGDVIVGETSITKTIDDVASHESRIATLEEGHNNIDLSTIAGLDDFVIDSTTLKANENNLEIMYTAPENYDGDLFEVRTSEWTATLSFTDGKYKNIKINDTQTYADGNIAPPIPDTVFDVDCPRIYNCSLELFTSGFLRINFIAQTTTLTTEDNVKCRIVDAENCFKLYRSPLPDFYEMKTYGETDHEYYCDYGYVPGTAEFDELIDGQTFEFYDEIFGTEYKMKKVGDEWQGTNYSWHVPGDIVINGDTKFINHKCQAVMIKKNDTNGTVMEVWLKRYDDLQNPFEMMKEQNLITFEDCDIEKYSSDNNYYYLYLKCTQKKSCNFSVTLNINNVPYTTEFGFEYNSYEAESCYKVNSPNCYNFIPYHNMHELQVGNPPYGLVLYMPKDEYMLFTITDVEYTSGTNTFGF